MCHTKIIWLKSEIPAEHLVSHYNTTLANLFQAMENR